MKKDGNTDIKKTIVEICELVNPYPVSVEVTTNDSQEAFEQAVEFSTWAENINIKITIHGPNGEPNLKVINDSKIDVTPWQLLSLDDDPKTELIRAKKYGDQFSFNNFTAIKAWDR